jgi:hypothetical protein
MIINSMRLCNFRQFHGETQTVHVPHGQWNMEVIVGVLLITLLVMVAVLGFHGLNSLELLYRKAVLRMIRSLIKLSKPLQRCLRCGHRIKIGEECRICGSE